MSQLHIHSDHSSFNLIHEVYHAFPDHDTLVFAPGSYRFDPLHMLMESPEPDEVFAQFDAAPPRLKLIGEGEVVFKTDKLGFQLRENLHFENIRFVKDRDGRSPNFIELDHLHLDQTGEAPSYHFVDCDFDFAGDQGNFIWFQQFSSLKSLSFENCRVNFPGSLLEHGGPMAAFDLPETLAGLEFPGRLPHEEAIAIPPLPGPDLIPLGKYLASPGRRKGKEKGKGFPFPPIHQLSDRQNHTSIVSQVRSGFRISVDLEEADFNLLLLENGSVESRGDWKDYHRIKYAEILLDQQKVMTAHFKDRRGSQVLDLDPIQALLPQAKRLTLKVTGIYQGEQNRALALSGLYGISKPKFLQGKKEPRKS